MKSLAQSILGDDGPVARHAGAGFAARPEQLAMAQAVERSLAARQTLLVEAGTGVGKSFAYLVPAILRSVTTTERVVVATHTIALQEQLVGADVPALRASLPGWGLDPASTRPLSAVLVKGRGNYVSIRRLRLASQRQDQLFPDAPQRRSLHQIEDWAYATDDGSLSTLPPLERPGVWDRVQSDSDNCMGRKCPHYDDCFYQRARRAMEQANLLICNHAVFCSDLALRASGVGGFLPAYDHVIIDEAHSFEDAAADHFGLSLTEARVEHLLGVLHHRRSGKGYLGQLELMAGGGAAAGALREAVHATHACLDASRALFENLRLLARSGRAPSGRLGLPNLVDNPVSPAMRSLALRLRQLREEITGEPDRFELAAYVARAENIANDAQALIEQSSPGFVYWLEGADDPAAAESVRPRAFRGSTRLRLAAAPVEVAPILREQLFARGLGLVLTSATLATGGAGASRPAGPARRGAADARAEPIDDRASGEALSPEDPAGGPFAHLAARLGCDRAIMLQLGSPFDYARQAELFADLSVPDPRAAPRAARGEGAAPPGRVGDAVARYHEDLAVSVAAHAEATDGGAFVLFTAFSTLNAVADELGPRLARLGLPMLVQGRDGPPGQILARFRQDDRAVLLGAASFWQGVDVRGRGLRNVIITKLPFDPPDRPLVEARAELIAQRGGDPFRDDALPRAILRFKQGFGRLIRGHDDAGRVVVLDPRLVTKGYGRLFVHALPRGVRFTVLRPHTPGDRRGAGGADPFDPGQPDDASASTSVTTD